MPAHETTVFAGIDTRTTATLPAWYRRSKSVQPSKVTTFAEAIRSLPRAMTSAVAYRNPVSGEWVETDRFTALVEPGRAAEAAETDPQSGSRSRSRSHSHSQTEGTETPGRTDGGPDSGHGPGTETGTGSTDADPDTGVTDPLFHVPSDSYTVINPTDVYGPLEAVLRERTHDGRPLGEVVFGEVREYRNGGEVHMDVLFDGLEVDLPGRSEPVAVGLTSGYDFFGGHAVYVEGFAQDTACSNSMRQLTDREAIKHVGEVGDFEAWWTDLLQQVDLVAEDLHGFITDASGVTVNLRDLPFDLVGFYDLFGFPEYLAERAAADARANAGDPFAPDLWTLHSGATYALTHHFRGREGSSLDRYVRQANDLLFNPEEALARVERAHDTRADPDAGDGTEGDRTGANEADVEIAALGDDLQAKVETFEAHEETLKERFATVAEN